MPCGEHSEWAQSLAFIVFSASPTPNTSSLQVVAASGSALSTSLAQKFSKAFGGMDAIIQRPRCAVTPSGDVVVELVLHGCGRCVCSHLSLSSCARAVGRARMWRSRLLRTPPRSPLPAGEPLDGCAQIVRPGAP